MATFSDFFGSCRFHLKHGWFNVREQFSDLASGIAGILLFPFFTWLMAQLWGKFNAYQGNYTYSEVILYVGATEILFMTFLRPASLSRASGDFSLSLARPRSWLATSFSGLFGRCLGNRLVYLLIFLMIMPLLGIPFPEAKEVALRLILFFPLLGIVQAFVGLLFASCQVLWAETSYFIFPISKIFLALGGVFGPLIDFGEPWRTALVALPPSDFFFQPAHFCVKGEFYRIDATEWMVRVVVLCAVLWLINLLLYQKARHYHQSYAG